ncbi:MAG: NADH-quinone oxidoreductase subunit N [Anaerolinea sp.]
MMTLSDFLTLLPAIVLLAWGVIMLVVDLFLPTSRKGITPLLSGIGAAAGLGVNFALTGYSQTGFNGMVVLDGFASFTNTLLLISSLFAIMLSYDYMRRMNIERSECCALMLISTAGMMIMVQAYDLIVLFLALELFSIPLYVMSGLVRGKISSEEAALKYFLLGAFSSAFLLYGVAFLYGATMHTNLAGIVSAIQGGAVQTVFLMLGVALLLVGLAFKLAVVPFHSWAPDVYQGAPTPVTGWMSVSVKIAALAALLRVFVIAFPSVAAQISPVLGVLAALTMIVGNVLALVQTDIKRLLAYSSIASAGYLLMAFVPYGQGEVASDSIAAGLFYMIGYLFASFAAWAVVAAVEKEDGKGLQIADYAGLARRHPWLAVAMMIAMVSYIGVPPTLGFWGKFYLFRTALEGGLVWLALIGLLTSLFSAYYYLRVVVVMFMQPGETEARREVWVNLLAVVSAGATLLLAFIPWQLLDLASTAFLRFP